MDQEQAFEVCMEIFAEHDSLKDIKQAFEKWVIDSPLGARLEEDILRRFYSNLDVLKSLFDEVKSAHIDFIASLD